MRNAERFTVAAVLRGLHKAGVVDNAALAIIATELGTAAEEANQYGSSDAIVIQHLVNDVRAMRI